MCEMVSCLILPSYPLSPDRQKTFLLQKFSVRYWLYHILLAHHSFVHLKILYPNPKLILIR
jgi:hypothetical protein